MSDITIWLRKQKINTAYLPSCNEDRELLCGTKLPSLTKKKWHSLSVTNWITASMNTIPNTFDYMSSQKITNHGFESGDFPVPAWCPIAALWQKARVSRIAMHHTHPTGFLQAASQEANDKNANGKWELRKN